MNISFTGDGLEVTEALKNETTKKFGRLTRHFDRNLLDVHVIFNVQKLQQNVEAIVQVRGGKIHAKASSDVSMYQAIDQLTEKLERQLEKHKST